MKPAAAAAADITGVRGKSRGAPALSSVCLGRNDTNRGTVVTLP